MDAMETMQATLDEFQQEMPEGAYLKLCNCVKELHHLTKLYEVTFYEIYYNSEGGYMQSRCHVRIMVQDDDFQPGRALFGAVLGKEILTRGKLPRAEDGRVPTLQSTPFELNGHYFVITHIKRYLKRLAEDA
eukprot:COSAG01_NODE_5302_length_4350_cov_31.768055_4_plen_132_part_00